MALEPAVPLVVLVADKNTHTRLYLQRVLNTLYETHVVSDGRAALAVIREHPPALVLADIIMPLLDGVGLLQALRADPHTRDIPVILLSALADEDSRVAALKAGAADYLTKPFDASELLARLSAQLEIARLRREKLELEHELRVSKVANVELAHKNSRLRRARNAIQRKLKSKSEDVSQLTQNLIADRQALLGLKDELAAELAAMNRLHELNTRLLAKTNLQPLLEEVLDATTALLNADFGNVQLYDPKSHALKIVAQRGFKQDFLDSFDSLREGTASCGAALERRERVIVEDVLTDPVFASHLEIVAAGYRAVQSTPLISRGGEMLGMISTHFRQAHRPSEHELRLVDLHARQAAELIERKQAEEALRGSEEKYRTLFESIDEGFCTIEVLFDENEKPIDYRFLEVNPSFEKQTGIHNAQGRTMREIAPLHEEHWFEIYGKIAFTGEPVRFENRAAQLHRWYDVYAFRVGEPQERKVAVLFNDSTERKRAELGLLAAKEEAERRAREAEKAQSILHTIMEHAPDGITLTGGPPDFLIIANSKQSARMLGRDAETLLNIPSGLHADAYGLLLPDGTHPRPEQLALYRASRHGEVIKNEEWIVERPDGSRIHEISNVAPIRDFRGQVIGAIKCWRDITELKQAETELRASEERFRRYFDLGLIGMAITSPGKGCIEVNDELCRILGYERGEMLQKTWEEMTHPEDLPADVAQFNRVMAGEFNGYTSDKRWIRKDGRIIDSIVAMQCMRRADGSVEYFVGLVLDTTERKRAEEELRRSEAYLAEAQRLSHTGSWGWNIASGKVVWSRETFRIFGVTPAEVEPSHDFVVRRVHPEDRLRVAQVVERAARENCDFRVEYRIVLPDGSIKHLEALGHPVKNDSGNLQEIVGAVMDITERKRAETTLQKLQGELAQVTRMTAMGELAASIAHEINQPLGAIVNNANVSIRLVTAGHGSRDELVEVLSDIVGDATRTSAIIKRIRELMTKTAPEKTSLQLKDVVADVLALAQRELEERRIEVCTELAEDLPSVSGDRVQLQQVLLNLVMNGIDAISAAADERRILTIGGQSDELAGNPSVRLAVRDSGGGFKAENGERLFDAFYTTKATGMGMGLRISRSIVEAHGGRLWATLNEDQGATFFCTLPIDN